jgi:hypothetical protein
MARPLRRWLLALSIIWSACTPAPGPAADADVDADPETASFAFTYGMDLGRDCFMMGDCGYRLVLTPDDTLRRFNDRSEETAFTTISEDERASLLAQLEAGGFFDLPVRLPDVPEGEIVLGGRVVTMAFESADGSRTHQVEAHTDGQTVPLPESFYALDEAVRTYLLGRLDG